ncbi:hypothetical protein MAR_019021 [Mya arenaria]|uniref:Uncharacterized protein n=1 Tax=Mya arenaria TaxID=6604 RepID=A0ABY7EGC9_MYAAR|nr:hypothetical protein MAR_019021 [Mya arenaria]
MVPHILVNHCVAHRQLTRRRESFRGTAFSVLPRLWLQNSVSIRDPDYFEEPKVKVTEAKDVRWLSQNKAVEATRRCLSSLLTILKHEARE